MTEIGEQCKMLRISLEITWLMQITVQCYST